MKKPYTPRIGSMTEQIMWHLAEQPDGKEACTSTIRNCLGVQTLPVFQLLGKAMEHGIVVARLHRETSGPMYYYLMLPEHKQRFKRRLPEWYDTDKSASMCIFQNVKPHPLRKDLEILIRSLHEAKTNVHKHIALCDLFEAINLKPPVEAQDFMQLKRVPAGFTSAHHIGRADGGSFSINPTQYFDVPLFLE